MEVFLSSIAIAYFLAFYCSFMFCSAERRVSSDGAATRMYSRESRRN